MHRRWRDPEISLHVRLGGRTPVKLGVVIDEREVLALFFRKLIFHFRDTPEDQSVSPQLLRTCGVTKYNR